MKEMLESVLNGENLSVEQGTGLFERFVDPEESKERIAAMLIALRAKGECADEVLGFARAMRQRATDPDIGTTDCIDVVGTGGDGSGSLNISTGVALLCAAAGLPVVKHGNSSISSKSGSADVLRELGLKMPLAPDEARRLFSEVGFTFLFAPHYHPSMAAVAPVRKALGVRTVFNILGPLTNPAQPGFGLIGAFNEDAAALMADALSGLPIRRAYVVHGAHGWDEATPVGPFQLWDVRPNQVTKNVRDPRDFGIERCNPSDLAGGDPAYNANSLRDALGGQEGPHRDTLVLGTALSLELSGRCESMEEGVARAGAAIDDGRAEALLASISRSSSVSS